MTEENPKIDGRTRRAADIALAKRNISRASYDAILAGTLSLQQGKEYGRDRGPDIPEGSGGRGGTRTAARSASAGGTQDGADSPRTCLCGCGEPVTRTFRPGHDSRLRSELVAQIRKGDVLLRSERITDRQREFAVRHGLISGEALPPETGEENQHA